MPGKKDGSTRVICSVISAAHQERLKEIAKKLRRSMSSVIAEFVEDRIAIEDAKTGRAQ